MGGGGEVLENTLPSLLRWPSIAIARLAIYCSAHPLEMQLSRIPIFCTSALSSPRAESARAVTGRRCPHSGRGEDFLSRQPDFFTETAVTPERKVEKSFPRWEINRHVEG